MDLKTDLAARRNVSFLCEIHGGYAIELQPYSRPDGDHGDLVPVVWPQNSFDKLAWGKCDEPNRYGRVRISAWFWSELVGETTPQWIWLLQTPRNGVGQCRDDPAGGKSNVGLISRDFI